MQEGGLGAQDPSGSGELREQQDRQRRAKCAAGENHQCQKQQVAGQQAEEQSWHRHRERVLLHPPECGEPEQEIKTCAGYESVGVENADHLGIEQQCGPQQQCRAYGTVQPDDPQDAAPRVFHWRGFRRRFEWQGRGLWFHR